MVQSTLQKNTTHATNFTEDLVLFFFKQMKHTSALKCNKSMGQQNYLDHQF